MLTKDGIRVIEYNARFGDPEAQVVLPRLKTDLLLIMEACILGRLSDVEIEWLPEAAVCVIEASGGYPGEYAKGFVITGLCQAKEKPGTMVFHAGTEYRNGQIITSGGRVLGICGMGATLEDAIKRAYEGVDIVDFEKKHFRRDIGVK